MDNFPLGICRQAIMKLDSLNTDLHEMIEDEGVNEDAKFVLYQMSEFVCSMEAALTNMATQGTDEEEFLSEDIQMDIIEPFPAYVPDILDTEININT